MEWNSRSRMAAMTAPGTTPAVAIPTMISGSYERTTLSASARDSSPNRGHSTSKTPLFGSAVVRRGDIGGAPEGGNHGQGSPTATPLEARYVRGHVLSPLPLAAPWN